VYFLLTSFGVIVVRIIPSLRAAFIPYGKTLTVQKSESLLQWLANITVPKAWFWHYYFVSVVLSGFWGTQFVTCSLDSSLCVSDLLARVDGRTILVWAMMSIQGYRRLYESLYVQKASSARMWIGHYLVGNAFYVTMSIAVLADRTPRAEGSFLLHNSDCRFIIDAVRCRQSG
jgi:3-oxo-5-alpha-steroid 4-dehydrogenase 3